MPRWSASRTKHARPLMCLDSIEPNYEYGVRRLDAALASVSEVRHSYRMARLGGPKRTVTNYGLLGARIADISLWRRAATLGAEQQGTHPTQSGDVSPHSTKSDSNNRPAMQSQTVNPDPSRSHLFVPSSTTFHDNLGSHLAIRCGMGRLPRRCNVRNIGIRLSG